jgi:hypothetical protein
MFLHNQLKRWPCVTVVVLFAGLSRLQAQSPDLPAGPVQEKVRTACTECHDSYIIRQQRLSGKAWAKEVDKMIKWGAVVDPVDRDAFIGYLSINFPPEKLAGPAEKVAPGKKR